MILFLFAILASYLLGSIPTAYLVGKWAKGIDIRKHGSGNVGASNVFRVIGKKWGSFVLGCDVLKGFIPAFLIPWLGFESSKVLGLVFGLSAITGHNWPIFLKFKGGKGVATSAGVFLGILPLAVCSALAVWIVTVWITNFIAVGSIIASFSMLLFVWVFYRALPEIWLLLAVCLTLSLLSIYMHRANLDRIQKGTENRIFKNRRR